MTLRQWFYSTPWWCILFVSNLYAVSTQADWRWRAFDFVAFAYITWRISEERAKGGR